MMIVRACLSFARLDGGLLSCARDLEALPVRLRHSAECCHYVEAPYWSTGAIIDVRMAVFPGRA